MNKKIKAKLRTLALSYKPINIPSSKLETWWNNIPEELQDFEQFKIAVDKQVDKEIDKISKTISEAGSEDLPKAEKLD
jgi:hypothetical protein